MKQLSKAMEMEEDVVIVGGGIAGLATAIGLMRIGVPSLVLERSKALRTTGAALSLFPNAWLALDALGVSDQLTSIYTPLHKGSVTDITNGNVQEVIYGRDRNTTGPRAVHRSALLKALAEQLPLDTIRFSSKLKSIRTVKQGDSTITYLALEDETIVKAKVVIGCDGVNSVVGQQLGLNAPIDSGRSGVRGLSVFSQGHGLKHEVVQFVDGVSRAGYIPLNDKEVYWFVTCRINKKDEGMVTEGPESIQKFVLDNMAHFPTKFLNVVHHSDLASLSWAPFLLRAPWDLLLKNLYKDNITVAGDAMHPMTPDLGQGGCASLEDAVVLCRHIGNSLVQNGKIGSNALEGYVKERRCRAAMLISASYFSGWIQQGGSGWLKVFLRDKVFYKFFSLLTARVVCHNCGKLPSVMFSSLAEETRNKSE